jgi:two-component system response regulator FixJ
MNLVVVDDDGDVRKALARLLRCLGHQVDVFDSVEAFDSQSFSPDCAMIDCAIIDVRMPGESGIRLCERLRARDLPVPVVLISGESTVGIDSQAAIGATPSIAKPFDDATLVEAITDAIAARPQEEHGAV